MAEMSEAEFRKKHGMAPSAPAPAAPPPAKAIEKQKTVADRIRGLFSGRAQGAVDPMEGGRK